MTTIAPMRIGLIGCGDIARKAYVPACRRFASCVELAACADLDVKRAEGFAKDLGIPCGTSVEAMLADPGIELVVNLTIPRAHAAVDLQALAAGKHVFSEKPFGISRAEGRTILQAAAARSLRMGCAPDTVLGSGVQTARTYIDQGLVGDIIGGACHMISNGPEDWHPNPGFLYQRGAGPLLDMGPYYLHALVTLIGPVRRVSAVAKRTWPSRTILSQPLRGTVVPVEVQTHVVAILEFHSGAVITLTVSFDVRGGHTLPNVELFGSAGTIQVPDPNFTDGPVRLSRAGMHPLMEYQRTHPYRDGSRGVGVADMALAIRSGRPHRASAELAMHALDVMEAIAEASASGSAVDIVSTCERPEAMRADLPEGVLDAGPMAVVAA
jgi:predicted dehydrogenase